MAGDSYDATVTNLAAFDAAMTADIEALRNLEGPLAAAAREAIALAQAAAPHLTGRLAGSHRAAPAEASKVRVVVDTPYAAAIHWGWQAHGIGRQPWFIAAWMRSPAPLDKIATVIQSDLDKGAART